MQVFPLNRAMGNISYQIFSEQPYVKAARNILRNKKHDTEEMPMARDKVSG